MQEEENTTTIPQMVEEVRAGRMLRRNFMKTLAALGLSETTVNIGAGSWQAVSVYMIVLAVISFVCVLGLKELTRADISNPDTYKVGEAVLVGED